MLFSFGCERKENEIANQSFSSKEIVTSIPYCSANDETTPCVMPNTNPDPNSSGAIFICSMGVYEKCCPELGPDEFFDDANCIECADREEEKCKRDFKRPCIAIIIGRDEDGTASRTITLCDQEKINQFEKLIK